MMFETFKGSFREGFPERYYKSRSFRLDRSVQRQQATRSTVEQRTSLIPETLRELSEDKEQQALVQRLQQEGQAHLSKEERRKRQRSLDSIGAPPFPSVLKEHRARPLRRDAATTLQLNIGLYCNQACSHCHVESSPLRKEAMDRATAQACLRLLAASGGSVRTLDITGGAPELNPQFRFLVTEARKLGVEIIDRCNLTVLQEPGQEDLVEFLAQNQVRVVASLPCYSEGNVDEQRGRGVFERSIAGLCALNAVGYGRPGSGLTLDLVYNPNGAFLAPPQQQLQEAYKAELAEAYGITFNGLLCLNNMPIKRYVDYLQRKGQLEGYMALLLRSFNAAAAEAVMCRATVSVGWDGRIYDCDFNQQLELGLRLPGRKDKEHLTVFDIETLDQLTGVPIACDNHCFGCTAGSGSSCQGAIA
ncbi:g9196 [Coccomyxa elongata]